MDTSSISDDKLEQKKVFIARNLLTNNAAFDICDLTNSVIWKFIVLGNGYGRFSSDIDFVLELWEFIW